MARRRLTATYLNESQILARAAAHVLEVLKRRHPESDDARVALRYAIELEAHLTEQASRIGKAVGGHRDGAETGVGPQEVSHGTDRS